MKNKEIKISKKQLNRFRLISLKNLLGLFIFEQIMHETQREKKKKCVQEHKTTKHK